MSNNKGFTLIELIVVTGIIALLTALTLPNYRAGDNQLALQRSASKVTQNIRRAQEMAMSAKEFQCPGGKTVPVGGYGLFFNALELYGVDFPHQFVLFADCNGDYTMTLPEEEVEIIDLEKKIKFAKFYLDGVEDVGTSFTFIPPDPQTCIVDCTYVSTEIIVSLEDNPSETKTIFVNEAGLIAVE